MKIVKITGVALTAAALMSFPTSALALDGKDFAKKLSAVFETGGMSVSFAAIDVAGDAVTLSDPTFTPVGEDPATVMGDLVFTGVSEVDDGSYLADKGEIAEMVFEEPEEGVEVTVENILIEDVRIPAEPYGDPTATFDAYSRFSMGPLTVVASPGPGNTEPMAEIFSIASIEVTNTVNDDLTKIDNTYVVDGILADLSLIDDPEPQAMLALFGLTKIEARMQGESVWTLDDGRVDLIESAIIINNVGTLDITADILGYDLELITQLQNAQKDMMANSEKSTNEIDMASMDMMMDMMNKLVLAGATIRFEDDGITNNILDFIAEQQGAPREVLAAGFGAALPVMAAEMGFPTSVQTMLLNAANDYLADPKSVEIISAPDAPVPFTAIAGAIEDPAEITELLNISVVANQE